MLRATAEAARRGGPALFLDRDGVINRSIPDGFAVSTGDVVLNDDVIAAIARHVRTEPVLVISNQSCVGRGLIGEDRLQEIMRYVTQGAAERGLRIDGWYCCPHTDAAGCACRKPLPGMLLAAAYDFGLDLRRSAFIGDQDRDAAAARAAGALPFLVAPDDARGVERALVEWRNAVDR